MNTIIATDFAITSYNGRYYYQSQLSTIIDRYYCAFGKLNIISRTKNVDEISTSYVDVTEQIASVVSLPSQSKVLYGGYDRVICQAIEKSDFVIARCPGMISHRVAQIARKKGVSYLAESMGCAWDAYWNHGFTGKIIAPYMFFSMRNVVKNADYAVYVTSRFLQNRYPCKNESITASNVSLYEFTDETMKNREIHILNMDRTRPVIMTIAAVDVEYKGQEYVIKALAKLKKKNIFPVYYLVGGGDTTRLSGIAKKLRVENQVVFKGRVTFADAQEQLEKCDIYIQPSLQEGLPRALIEAMAKGCICIGAKTAGIPELLLDNYVTRRKSVSDIVEVIEMIINSSEDDILCNSRRNYEESMKYQQDVLNQRRNDYYAKILVNECRK